MVRFDHPNAVVHDFLSLQSDALLRCRGAEVYGSAGRYTSALFNQFSQMRIARSRIRQQSYFLIKFVAIQKSGFSIEEFSIVLKEFLIFAL